MKKKKLNLTKKQSQRIKTLVLGTGLLICCCIVFVLIITLNVFGTKVYKVESRVDNIEREQKNEKSSDGYGTIGWLKVQGTNIDTPIVGYEKVSDFSRIDKENFLWNDNYSEKMYNQVVISGHNILNLSKQPKVGEKYFSRFDDLMAFVYEDFVEENKYIQYTVDGKDYLYKIFAVFFEHSYNVDLSPDENYTKKQTKEYIEQAKELTIYDFNVDVKDTDSLISLTTCTRFYGKYNPKQIIVVGRLLRENEKADNYKVSINEKYEEIRNIMEGDDENAQA